MIIKAFVIGDIGRDNSYLAELLLENDYVVNAIIRRSSVFTIILRKLFYSLVIKCGSRNL